MPNLIKNKYFYIWCAVSLCIGIAIGLPFSIEGFSFSWKIELFDVVTLCVSIALAIYVANSLEKRVQDDRIEKELHIEQINQIEKLLNELEDILRSNCIEYNNIISRISKVRIKKNNIFKALTDCLPDDVSLFKDNMESISASIDTIKRLLTDTSVDGNPEVVMKDGVLTYSINRISDINNNICALENDLFRLKIILNRL